MLPPRLANKWRVGRRAEVQGWAQVAGGKTGYTVGTVPDWPAWQNPPTDGCNLSTFAACFEASYQAPTTAPQRHVCGHSNRKGRAQV